MTPDAIAREIAWNMIQRFDHSAGLQPEKYATSVDQLADELLTFQRQNIFKLADMLRCP